MLSRHVTIMKLDSYDNLMFILCLTWLKKIDKIGKLHNYWLCDKKQKNAKINLYGSFKNHLD